MMLKFCLALASAYTISNPGSAISPFHTFTLVRHPPHPVVERHLAHGHVHHGLHLHLHVLDVVPDKVLGFKLVTPRGSAQLGQCQAICEGVTHVHPGHDPQRGGGFVPLGLDFRSQPRDVETLVRHGVPVL